MRSTILDIECIALPEAAEYIEAPSAPSNYKDPQKIADYIAEKTAQELGRCALDPDLCQVVAIGVWNEGALLPLFKSIQWASEREMLAEFWQVLSDNRFIGFNILSYDLSVLIRRSQYLGISYPKVNLDRYRTNHVDLMQELSFRGALKYRGLKFYAKRFNLGVPDDDEDGSKVAEWVAAGDWAKVEHHLRRDLERTRGLALKLGYLTGDVPQALATMTAAQEGVA